MQRGSGPGSDTPTGAVDVRYTATYMASSTGEESAPPKNIEQVVLYSNEVHVERQLVRLDLSRLDDITGQVRRSTEESLSRLRCDSVELLQLHNPIGPQTVDQLIGVYQVLGEDGVADALGHLREEGLTRLIGITAIGDTAACRRVIASGRFDSAQVYYNILNPSAGQDMPPAWRGRDFGGLIETSRARAWPC